MIIDPSLQSMGGNFDLIQAYHKDNQHMRGLIQGGLDTGFKIKDILTYDLEEYTLFK